MKTDSKFAPIYYQAKLATPFAVLGIFTNSEALTGIEFLPLTTPPQAAQSSLAQQACDAVFAYLRDPDYRFNLPIAISGTLHQRKVWQALAALPVGVTCNYADLAKQVGSSPRAVGQACGSNPLPLIIPCHRVVAKNGMGGFMHSTDSSALSIKQWLLRHEATSQRSAA